MLNQFSNGTIDFAQNIVTVPEYLNTKTISIYHRTIYVVLADCVYIYIRSEKKGFDTAIDIPFHLISDIRVETTPLDRSIGTEPPADLILHVKCTGEDQAYVNSSPSELSVVQLTFRNTAEATNISKAVQHCGAKLNSGTGRQVMAADNEAMSDHSDSEPTKKASFIKASQSNDGLNLNDNNTAKAMKRNSSMKASQTNERLALDGNHKDTNPKTTKKTSFIDDSQSDKDLILYGNRTDTNEKATKQASFRRTSQTDKGFVLNGNYDINTEATGTQGISDIHANSHDTESPREESSVDFVSLGMAANSSPIIVQDKVLPTKKSQSTIDNGGNLYDASPVAHDRRRKVSIAAAPANSSVQSVPPILTTASGTQDRSEVGGVGKTSTSLRRAPIKVNTRIEDNEESGMTINTSDEFGISSPHIHQSPSVVSPGNPADDALLPTQHDGSTDELDKTLPLKARPKKKPALKSKKPLGLSKKADEKENSGSRSTKQPDKASERKHALAKGDTIGETRNTGDVDIALDKTPKQDSEQGNESWNIEADSPKLTALPLKKPVETGKRASKKRKTELDVPDRPRRGTRRNALSVKETANESADGADDKNDARPGPSGRANKPSSTKLAKIEQVDEKEDSVAAHAVVRKPKKGKKKLLLRPKAALKVKEAASNDMSHADTGGQHVESDGGQHMESDVPDPLQRHESFFEEAFHDYELPNVDDEPPFTPMPPVNPVTKMASKMVDIFGFAGESSEPQRKTRVYGKSAQKTTRAPQKQSKSMAKVTLKGKEREEVDPLPEVDLLPEQPEQKRRSVTTGKSPATTLGKEVEMIYISSDEESEDSGDIEPCQPHAIAQGAMAKLDEKSISATAVKTESSMPALLEAPSDLSPEDQSTPAMTLPPNRVVPVAVAPIKLRNSSAHLVDDHLSRKTPIVAFDRNGPKNKGLSSALKPKPVENSSSKIDMAKLVNAVALGQSRKRPSPEPTEYLGASPPKRVKKVEVAANKAVDDDACNDDITNMLPHRLKSSTPFATQQDSLICSSQSRVDENGSPHARPTVEETANVAQIRRRTLSIPRTMPHTGQNKDITTEKGPFDDPDDDMHLVPTMLQNFDNPSPNRKPQLFGRQKEVPANSRHLSSRPTRAGKNLEVIPETDHATTVNSVNPFEERQPRQLSNFAKRLKGEQPARSKVKITTKFQPQLPLKAANGQPRKRSFVFEPEVVVHDPEKTLVEAENQYQWRRARSISSGSTESSSDTVDDKASVAESEEEELTPELEWRKTLELPYKNLTDTILCIARVSRNPPQIYSILTCIQTLVGDLIDKETAIGDIVDEYARNGMKLVEELEREASADRRELESQFSNMLQQVAGSFKQTRDVTVALNSEWEDLDDLEAQWRTRQHELQNLMEERVKCVKDGTWKNQIKN